MKKITSILLALLIPSLARADLPKTFDLKENFTFFQSTYSVENNGATDGKVVRDLFSWGTNFTYLDASGKPAGKAQENVFSWGHESRVFDGDRKLIGTIKEQVFTSFFSMYNEFDIRDATGQQIAKSQRISLFETDFEITDMQGKHLARLHRDWICWPTDTWHIEVDTTRIDPRLILFIGTYKTEADNSKHHDH